MHDSLEAMLSSYHPQDRKEKENAIKEIIQEIVLSGLSRGGFFDRAAFYGGTCLRLFHGLNRFSEDLDFALLDVGGEFRIEDYLPYVRKELASFGINMEVQEKGKKNGAGVQSAFVRGLAASLYLLFFPKTDDAKKTVSNQAIKVKFEIDTENVPGGVTETRYRFLPSPYQITVYDESTLFSGKVHALICRHYGNRVKGRDYYDYLFYRGKGTKLNLRYLENKLKNTGFIPADASIDIDWVKKTLADRFAMTDFQKAKQDVRSFIRDSGSLDLWGPELFEASLQGLEGNDPAL